jgi:hypothetical protein
MLAGRLLVASVALAVLATAHTARAHGIAGNRYFPGTLTFDDPAIADEAIVPLYSTFKHPAQIGDGDVVDNAFDWSFIRLLTPKLEVGASSGWINRNWGVGRRSGFDVTSVDLEGEIYRNDLHETLISAGVAWGFAHTGAQGVGANAPNLLAPGIFFGKGFGDLSDNLAWLRPFGITGAVSFEQPLAGGTSPNIGLDSQTGQLGSLQTRNVEVVHWGVAVEFSTLYLTNRFMPRRLPKEEPLNQFVPLVEFAFDSVQGTKTFATMYPGLSYVAVSWQLAAEAIVPLNGATGRSVGARAAAAVPPGLDPRCVWKAAFEPLNWSCMVEPRRVACQCQAIGLVVYRITGAPPVAPIQTFVRRR